MIEKIFYAWWVYCRAATALSFILTAFFGKGSWCLSEVNIFGMVFEIVPGFCLPLDTPIRLVFLFVGICIFFWLWLELKD